MWVVLVILKIILFLLAALLLLLITSLLVPVTYKGEAEVSDGISFRYKAGWLWNIINIRGIGSGEGQTTEVFLVNKRLFAVKAKGKENSEPEKKSKKKAVKEAAKKENNLKSMFDTRMIKEGLSFLKRVIKQLSPKYLHLQGTYGFDDPSVTGMIAGFIYTLQGILPQSRILLQPSFTEEILELEFKAAGVLFPAKLAWETARFLLKKDIRTKIFKRNKKVKLKLK